MTFKTHFMGQHLAKRNGKDMMTKDKSSSLILEFGDHDDDDAGDVMMTGVVLKLPLSDARMPRSAIVMDGQEQRSVEDAIVHCVVLMIRKYVLNGSEFELSFIDVRVCLCSCVFNVCDIYVEWTLQIESSTLDSK